jgi:cyclic-di-AMP phosphodiesterase
MGILRSRLLRIPLIILTILAILTASLFMYFNVIVGFIYGIIATVVIAYAWYSEIKVFEQTEKHIETLSFRMKKVGEEAFFELPIGILLINDQYKIEWANPFVTKMLDVESLIGEDMFILSDGMYSLIKPEEKIEITITVRERKYRVFFKREEKLLYFFDVTEQVEIESQYFADRTVLGILFIDNYDEITSTMDDQSRSMANSLVTSIINGWASREGIFVKRVASDRFIAVLNESILTKLENEKFSILDDVREKTANSNLSLTLSIGIGVDSNSLIELGQLAQSSLDLVLGRGGDQVAIKQANGKIRFYGGKTNPVEKRTRVRARVISHALRDLIQGSDKVFVMGHSHPDMDAIGAAIGVRKMAAMNNVEGFIVVNFDQLNGSVSRLMNELKERSNFYERFISVEEALSQITANSLLVIVDTHKPSLVIDERLFSRVDKVVVIDHHRRGEEFVKNPTLVYMEPYASSTAELVTELLEYQPKNDKLTMHESTALLAGIIVDTKSFTLRTGARTFDAASYLRTNGADTTLVHRLLKEDVDTYVERSKIVQTVKFIRPGIAVATGDDHKSYDAVLIAQTADIILALKDVSASFVIAYRPDGLVGISARSLGELNVQMVMEKLGGGGHLTNAATQIEGHSIDEVKERLAIAVQEVLEGSNEA